MDMVLEREQIELLGVLVEAQRSVPRDQRRKFIVARTMQGDFLVHPGLDGNKDVYFGDLEVLERSGLIYITYPSRDPNVDVTPEGYAFYDARAKGEPTGEGEDLSQEGVARELLRVLHAIRGNRYQDEEQILQAKVLNAKLAPTYQQMYGRVPLISTDYPSRVWWTRAREHATQALAFASSGLTEGVVSAEEPSESTNVFIVHGHDHGLKETVARLIERLGYSPVILHEKPNRGRTIIEKFEQEADASFAVVLLTPDDEGRERATSGEVATRARQNVVWEFGYFTGALGRGRVVALLTDTELERPSDVQGVIYVPVRAVEDPGWRVDLAKEMRAAGLKIDMNRIVE